MFKTHWFLKLLLVSLILTPGFTTVGRDESRSASHSNDFAAGKHTSLGLSVNSNGILMKDGAPYKGIGVNYYDAFYRTLQNPDDVSYREGLQNLADNNIPFARFNAGGYWPSNFKLYLQDKDAYFHFLDGVVKAAEDTGVGLVPCLFFTTFTVPDLVGEPRNQWGNRKSKTREFMRTYTREIVSRYVNSPAIWGWEFGNEFPLALDYPEPTGHLPPVAPGLGTPSGRTARDNLTFSMFNDAIMEFATIVRSIDPVRILITGNSIPRRTAYHNYKEHSSARDTIQQFAAILLRDNPNPFNVICVHIYPSDSSRYFAEREVDFQELIQTCATIARDAKKPLYLEEFGNRTRQKGAEDPSEDARDFRDTLAALEASGTPLASIWVYDQKGTSPKNITFENERSFMLKAIAAANRKFQGRLQ